MNVNIQKSTFWSKEKFVLLMQKADKLFTPHVGGNRLKSI